MKPMTTTKLPPLVLVQDAAGLSTMLRMLKNQPYVAVDTESNSMYAYKERVCLLQFSIPEHDFLVDPIMIPDMTPLAPLFKEHRVEKILHGAEYDVMTLKRDFTFEFRNLFDTRIAVRTLGSKQSGLRDLLEAEFGVHIDKRYQRANWGKRPLSPDLLDYARLDTHYLIPLRHRLAQALQEAGRWEEAREACEYLTGIEAHDNGFDPQGFWRIRNAHELAPQQLAVLRELYLYRDAQARRLDKPAFKVMGDKTLHALAVTCPKDLEALVDVPGMTRGQIRRYGEGILKTVARGLQASIPRRKPNHAVDEAHVERYEALREWRKRTARARKVESDIILPREILWEIARIAPRDLETLKQILTPLEWRFQTYGREVLRVLWGSGNPP